MCISGGRSCGPSKNGGGAPGDGITEGKRLHGKSKSQGETSKRYHPKCRKNEEVEKTMLRKRGSGHSRISQKGK